MVLRIFYRIYDVHVDWHRTAYKHGLGAIFQNRSLSNTIFLRYRMVTEVELELVVFVVFHQKPRRLQEKAP